MKFNVANQNALLTVGITIIFVLLFIAASLDTFLAVETAKKFLSYPGEDPSCWQTHFQGCIQSKSNGLVSGAIGAFVIAIGATCVIGIAVVTVAKVLKAFKVVFGDDN